MIPLYCSVVLSNDLFPWMPTSKSVAICFASSPLTVSIANSYRQRHDTSRQKNYFICKRGYFCYSGKAVRGQAGFKPQTPRFQVISPLPSGHSTWSIGGVVTEPSTVIRPNLAPTAGQTVDCRVLSLWH